MGALSAKDEIEPVAAARARLALVRERMRADPSLTINDVVSAEYWRDVATVQARRYVEDQLVLQQALCDRFRGTGVLYYGGGRRAEAA